MLRKLLTLIVLFGSTTVAPLSLADVTIVGSSTLEPFLKQWAETYQAKVPGAEIHISSPGTSVAPKALSSGKADLAAMNREMNHDESEAFIRAHGHYPTGIAVAIEAVALYAHPDNPVKGMDLKQVDAIFSAGHGCGWSEDIRQWGQLGLPAPWDKQPIMLLGHDKKSAVRDFFNKSVLCRDDFASEVAELKHEQLLAKVAETKNALGYGRYQPDTKLKLVPLKKGGDEYVALTPANVYNRSYKLQHFMYLYVNKASGKPVAAAIADFLKTGLSKEGQAAVVEVGYLPLSDELIQRQLNKLK
ncbi:MAG: PstS family phosphate ABC transporter substrate-binding protein [Pseudomonadota bacterium]|nr:PstS family phosphate ABC transporter substrate-binding protein [Gammaproteobacteria bacterium]MBU1733213.1 PstS family phosphate ABC transporter substrate-binding protein [Gammaproteobacteria bacterium]MBU1892261.1 PstS family phosphate ABC transporter substrate-binding protein [Gammaproteobacteria bacterium]